MKILANEYRQDEFLVNQLSDFLERSLSIDLSIQEVINTLDIFSKKVLELDINEEVREEVSRFCSKKEIENKIVCELGSLDSYEIKKRDFGKGPMEGFYPLGVVLHITPSNSPGLSFLAMIESLLGLNSNIVKLSRRDSEETFKLCELLFKCDDSEKIKNKTVILQGVNLSVENLVGMSDAVSCWGGDEAISNIRNSVPVSKRFITWGHKISFSLISKGVNLEESAKKLAQDIVQFDQQACSAPQICYILDANFDDLKKFSEKLKIELNNQSGMKPLESLDIQEQAELTNIKELIQLESLIEEKDIIESSNNDWRIYIENNSSIKASPLKRSIWLKPIKLSSIVSTFKDIRSHLQTVGVDLDENFSRIVQELFKAGALRVRELGEMQNSYSGEPHDGEQALRRFVKRISLDIPNVERNFRFSELSPIDKSVPKKDIMTKEKFQKITPDYDLAHLFFRSGGSSGKTAISPFSYNAYHRQMQAAAEGLFAAGLNPSTDKIANLFFGGGLYGGFLSFYTILEKLKVVQYPLAAYEDKSFVASVIAENDINTIVGMPSFIMELFKSETKLLKKSNIKKIFFGGEHFGKAQRDWLEKEFAVEVIRSASYGSVDAGPLGFQCEFSEGGVHHLNESIQNLEILKLDQDAPVGHDEIGRLVFTSKARDCITIERYDLGDLGRWVDEKCECNRTNRRFELLGRHGDIFRVGGTFFNFMKIQKILIDSFNYSDAFQIVISNKDNRDKFSLVLSDKYLKREDVLAAYSDLNESVLKEKTIDFDINFSSQEEMLHSKNSGKLLRVIDERLK
jgi:phenylacetate-coenzyme A ligase PaaK-like adenylate-forming protein